MEQHWCPLDSPHHPSASDGCDNATATNGISDPSADPAGCLDPRPPAPTLATTSMPGTPLRALAPSVIGSASDLAQLSMSVSRGTDLARRLTHSEGLDPFVAVSIAERLQRVGGGRATTGGLETIGSSPRGSGAASVAAAMTEDAAATQAATPSSAAGLLRSMPSLIPEATLPTFDEFLDAEMQLEDQYPTTDVVWRQTERERVYNFLLYVPYQLERIMWFGVALCSLSFLATLTLMPLRCVRALAALVRRRWRRAPPPAAPSSGQQPADAAAAQQRGLQGHELFDLLCAALLVASVACLRPLQPGLIYYWMKDVTTEFLKLTVVFSALEISDKILSNFGVDVLEALSCTCTLYMRGTAGLAQLASDAAVTLAVTSLHGAVLMCQGIVFAVAMNGKRHALLALLIASNFVEVKGTVHKRIDTTKLWNMARMDIVERFHLVVVLSFVVVEDMSTSTGWLPPAALLVECARVVGCECVIDVIKHAVLAKFNDIRPGIHREYMRDFCEDALDRQSHSVHKLVGFFPLGPAVLAVRMGVTLLWLHPEAQVPIWARCFAGAAAWVALCGLQLGMGYALKVVAHSYLCYRHKQGGGKALARVIQRKDGVNVGDRQVGKHRPKRE